VKELLLGRTTWIWLLLVVVTATSWWLGQDEMGLANLRYASLAIIVLAFIKVRFVILDFMEVRHAPLPMRVVGEAWIVIVCAVLVTLYLRAAQ
jgi:hypothetical protein